MTVELLTNDFIDITWVWIHEDVIVSFFNSRHDDIHELFRQAFGEIHTIISLVV